MAVATFAAVLVWGGCASGSFSPDVSCSSDEDCEQGQCIGGLCQLPDTSRPVDTGQRPVDTDAPDVSRDTEMPGGDCSLFSETSRGLSFISRRQGYCNPATDPDGTAPFQQCRTSGNMCTHAVRCAGGSHPECVKWCRPGQGDCRGTGPDQYQARGVCHKYTFPGIRKIGRCVPDCGSSSVKCPDGYQCRNGMCRKECTAATVADDCCGGSSPCSFECSNGFCQ
ncbi:MAG: hypothetical protein ABEN55_08280 [Bradymonadaceae bacterium]